MNPLQRAFEDIGQRDFDDTELGPICIGVDAFTGKSIWYRDRAPAPDYATYSDGTPPDPAHENAGDRAERKTRELLAGRPHIPELRAGPPGWFELSMSGRLPPNAPPPVRYPGKVADWIIYGACGLIALVGVIGLCLKLFT